MIKFYNHLPAEDMGKEMGQAEYVISRCGYSTVMDLVQLQKKSILIPTPGQTEQEYLANYLSRKQIICSIPQKGFSLTIALQKAAQTSYKFPSVSNENKLERIIAEFIQTFAESK
jgi:predicted glycosyltransferase